MGLESTAGGQRKHLCFAHHAQSILQWKKTATTEEETVILCNQNNKNEVIINTSLSCTTYSGSATV